MPPKKKTQIKADSRNARIHDERNREAISKSLAELGAGRSILIDANDTAIAGNGVLAEAERLGIPIEVIESDGSKLYAIKRTDLQPNDAKRIALAVADNRASDLSVFDDAILNQIFEELSAFCGDLDLEVTGFDLDEIEARMTAAGDMPGENEVPGVPDEAVTQPGDLYELGPHRVLCGDATNEVDVSKLVSEIEPSLVFTDPPFDLDHAAIDKMWCRFPKTMQIWILNDVNAVKLISAHLDVFYTDFILFMKNTMLTSNRLPIVAHALMPVFNFRQAHSELMQFYTVIEAGRDLVMASKGVSHAKSLATYRPILEHWMLPEEIIVDWCLHSGTSLICADQLGRVCYGMEIEPRYVDVIVRRYCNHKGLDAEKVLVDKRG